MPWRTLFLVGELSLSASCSSSTESPSPFIVSWILAIVHSRLLRRVDGLVAVVPSEARRPCPAGWKEHKE